MSKIKQNSATAYFLKKVVTALTDSIYMFSSKSSVLHIKMNEIQPVDENEDENK